jgi:hypothetical protein
MKPNQTHQHGQLRLVTPSNGKSRLKNMKIAKQSQFIFEASGYGYDRCIENSPKTKCVYLGLNGLNPRRRGCNSDGRRGNPEQEALNSECGMAAKERNKLKPRMNTKAVDAGQCSALRVLADGHWRRVAAFGLPVNAGGLGWSIFQLNGRTKSFFKETYETAQ